MTKLRKHYSADQNAKIALTAIKEQQTVNEIASDFGVQACGNATNNTCSSKQGARDRRDARAPS